MHDPSIFNFRPSSLVRMSKDDIIDQYSIYPFKIGEGNDAVVYKAKEKFNGGKWRALKKIHRSYIEKEQYLTTEIAILKRLDHPGVLKIFEVFDDSEYVSIITELCEGKSLLQELKKRGRYSQNQARQLFRKLIEIVSYCHQNKIIHRDLKLENLVYCNQDSCPQNLRLIDFGMAFQWQSSARMQIKKTYESNKIVGTIYYMAPQIRNETYDHRVDIWSCGVILYALLTGQMPFIQEEDEDIIEAIKQRRVNYDKLRRKKCSNEAIDLLKRIFVNENKRISVEEILQHEWMREQKQNQIKEKEVMKYFADVPYRQFQCQKQYMHYYKKEIRKLEWALQQGNQLSSVIQGNQGTPLQKTLNWNNIYEFLKMDSVQKAIKIYLSYRLENDKALKYRGIYDCFKTNKKETILLQTLYDNMKQEHEQFLSRCGQLCHSQVVIDPQEETRHVNKKRKLSFKQDKIFSVKEVYQHLLKFFEQNKYRSIGYTMFLSWICDWENFSKEQVEFLRTSLRNSKYEDEQKRQNINKEISKIHKIVREKYLDMKAKTKSDVSVKLSRIESTKHTLQEQRTIPRLNLNISKIKQEQVTTKRTSKKSVKQNILESISPTLFRRNQLSQNQTKTERALRGNRLLDERKDQASLLSKIQKLMSFW